MAAHGQAACSSTKTLGARQPLVVCSAACRAALMPRAEVGCTAWQQQLPPAGKVLILEEETKHILFWN